jgi:hypothetical protein
MNSNGAGARQALAFPDRESFDNPFWPRKDHRYLTGYRRNLLTGEGEHQFRHSSTGSKSED